MEGSVVRLAPELFTPGQKVSIADGPFRGFGAIFERYVRGPERVIVLLQCLGWKVEMESRQLAALPGDSEFTLAAADGRGALWMAHR